MLRLGESCSLESLLGSYCKTARFMQDQLFLHFCLWFAKGNEELIPVSKGQVALQALKSYVLERIDVVQFEPEVIARMFPACDVNIAHKRRDDLVLTFLKEVFSEFSRVRHLMLKDHDSVEYILEYVGSENLNRLSSVVVEDMNSTITKPIMGLSKSEVTKKSWLEYYLSQHFDGNLDIVIGGKNCSGMFERIVKYFRNLERTLSVYLFVDTAETLELTSFMDVSIQKLFITDCSSGHVSCKLEIPKCPHLTHLYLNKFYNIDFVDGIDASVLSALSTAKETGKLPNLTRLSFEDCRHGHNVPIWPSFFSSLLQSPWPYLSYLNLCECYLKLEDFQDLSAANDKGFFPNLESLLICDLYQENSSAVVPLFSHPWPKLTKLVLDNLATDSAKEMSVVWEKSPLLTDLTISLGPNQIPTGFKFEPHAVPNLKSLKVSHFNISMESLMVIIQSWNLTRLDTSHCEGITGMMSGLKYHMYAHLNSLFISNCDLNSGDLNVLAQASVGGRVPQLRHISKNQMCAGHLDCLFDNGCKWDSLLVLDIRQIPITRLSKKRAVFAKDLEVLCSKIDSGRLSSLAEVSFTMYLFEFPSFEQTVPWSHVTKLNMSHLA